jgi:hypothetical protein
MQRKKIIFSEILGKIFTKIIYFAFIQFSIAPKMDKQQMEFEEPEEKKVEADDEADDVKEEEAAADAEVQAATARGVEEEEEMLTTVVVETDSVQGLCEQI